MRFLVVDDQISMRKLVCMLIRETGLATEIHECPDGDSALRRLAVKPADFLVSDWNMPGMSGLDLLRTLRTDPEYADLKDIPVVLVTSESSREGVMEAVKLGISDYIVKPFDGETLMGKIARVAKAAAAAA